MTKHESVDSMICNDSKSFIGYSNDMDDIYEDIDEYNPIEKRKIMIIFGDLMADMLNNKKRNPNNLIIVTELFTI